MRYARSDAQWLTYWVIFGGFNFLESMSSVLVAWYVRTVCEQQEVITCS